MGKLRHWIWGRAAMWCGALALAGLPGAHGQTPGQLVAQMAGNEVAAKNQDTLYSYLADEVSARTGGHRWTEKVVETNLGALHRLLAVDGKPLDAAQAKAEGDRIAAIVRNPEEFRRLGNAHKDDEARSEQLLELLPKAFVITPAGNADGCSRFAFRPNPSFVPSTYEERVAAAMVGTVSVRLDVGRLCTLQAKIDRPVTFGFGLLGRIEQDGWFRLDRRPVDAVHWKSDRISVHIQGRLLLLKTLTKEQDVTRTQIRLIGQETSLGQAAEMTAP